MSIFVIVKEILRKYWGYTSFRPKQEEIIASALAGEDVLAILPTGGGKSLCFQLPTMMREGLAVVVSPLISLIKDQVHNLRSRGIKAIAIHSGMTRREIDIALDNAVYGDYKFLYLSPERLRTDLFRTRVQKMQVCFLVVDEAHCISQWGYDFRPDYLQISDIRTLLPEVPVIALTATATPSVAKDIEEKLSFRKDNIICSGFERPNLSYVVHETENKLGAVLSVCNTVQGTGIVYVRERGGARDVASFLVSQGVSAGFYHAGLSKEERNDVQQKWMSGQIRVIVATNAFGMGIDKPDVRFVCHFDLPEAVESYYQEAGRAGRDGLRSWAVLLWNKSDIKRLEAIYQSSFPGLDYIADIYQKVFKYLGIAYEDGAGVVSKFNLLDFVRRYRLSAAMAYNAIKYIESSGYWTLTEEIDNPTRIMFIVNRDDLYRIQLSDPSLDTFIKALMRIYPGLFSHLVSIDEEYVAKVTVNSVRAVKQKLLQLSRSGVLRYIPRARSPLIYIAGERLTPDNLYLSEKIYGQRKAMFKERLDAMYTYISPISDRSAAQSACRSRRLSAYFGQEQCRPCGICDLCSPAESSFLF
ncbi:MAG TPA: RecQ family ATP-dependent DNA helicase [Candidatus Coprenecus stercoravium]|uniref:DNA 3'-5' helicase n=1 Tax=Candidatus Coprenecus stercoravium TaxID=2840735 RepID=A0A9D2K854_9BACT|nr:RecQ family ATP-dependent DNA helicase [Candidatus Coprenecus stercoravium]